MSARAIHWVVCNQL